MTLYVVLNDNGELVIEHDYSGGRTTFIEDSGGLTEWEFDTSWEVPERAKDLVDEAIEDAVANADLTTAIRAVKDAATEQVVDDR